MGSHLPDTGAGSAKNAPESAICVGFSQIGRPLQVVCFGRSQFPIPEARLAAAPIHEGPLAQRRCSFWAAGCGVIRAQGLAPHGLRVLEAARAPQGGVPSASGWVGPLDALQARHHPRPGVARVSPRYCYGIARITGVTPMLMRINMGATPVRYRRDTVQIPCLLAWGYAGGKGHQPRSGAGKEEFNKRAAVSRLGAGRGPGFRAGVEGEP